TNVNPVRLRSANGIRSSPWKSPSNTFTFPTQSQPVTSVTDNFFDPSEVFNSFPHIYSFAGSDPDPAFSSLDEKNTKVRENNENDLNFDEETKIGCDDQCDDQGCFGKGPTKCIACRYKRMDSEQGECKPCHEACETCTGPDQKSCLACAPGHVRVVDLDICLQQCPEGYFEHFADRTCIPCQRNCAGCQDRPDHCTSCDHHLLLYQNKCLASCPTNTFETDDYRCAPCHESCETCTGSNSSQCIRCPSGRFWYEGRCIGECPAHHFADYNQRECIECPPGCSECNASTCISCLDDWKVNIKGRCQTQTSDKCDVDQYYDNGMCKQCHSTCDSCDGPTERACLSCASPLILQGTKCVGRCDDAYYHEKDGQICEPCLHTCAKCVAKMNCTECVSELQLQNGECHTTCATGYYSDMGLCLRCYMSCKTCSGPGSNQCVECPDSWLLLNGECRPDCPVNFFKSEYGCQKCHYSCVNCPECKLQEDKRKINVEALLLSAQPVSSLQFVNPFN
ncbi:hypothetical protein YQE_09613, partial [Dendroctonus ponderosae]